MRSWRFSADLLILPAVVVATAMFWPTLSFGQSLFPSPAFGTGGRPYSVAIKDINGDGIPDLSVANSCYNVPECYGVSVFLGNGNGMFRQPSNYQKGGGADSIAAGDVNADGRPDLVVLGEDQALTILIGIGEGRFKPWNTLKIGRSPVKVALADLDDNGNLDVIVLDSHFLTVGAVLVALGRGDGGFSDPEAFPIGSVPYGLAIADLDGNGNLDIAAINAGDRDMSVLLGQGDGTFVVRPRIPTGNAPIAIVSGDFNGDNKKDLATANSNPGYSPPSYSIFFGQGDGTFQPEVRISATTYFSGLAAGDFNADGIDDLAAPEYGGPSVFG